MPLAHVNGTTLYYEIDSPEHLRATPLVFIHGLGSSGRDWHLQRCHFSLSYPLVTVDLRGHGRSARPDGPYGVDIFSADIACLLHTLNIPRVHLIGISLGGMVALQLALDHPELVANLVVVNALPSFRARKCTDYFTLYLRRVLVRFLGLRRFGTYLAKRLFPGAGRARLRAAFISRWAENDPRIYLEILTAMGKWDREDCLSEICCPVLVVASEHDYTSVVDKRKYVARLSKGEFFVIPGAHHGVPVEFPAEFNRCIDRFLCHSEG